MSDNKKKWNNPDAAIIDEMETIIENSEHKSIITYQCRACNKYFQQPSYSEIQWPISSMHHCSDGSRGMSDLIEIKLIRENQKSQIQTLIKSEIAEYVQKNSYYNGHGWVVEAEEMMSHFDINFDYEEMEKNGKTYYRGG